MICAGPVFSGMARLGVAPHVADKVLNHQSGTISGVAAVYQRHDFLAERKDTLEKWAAHVLAQGEFAFDPQQIVEAACGGKNELVGTWPSGT